MVKEPVTASHNEILGMCSGNGNDADAMPGGEVLSMDPFLLGRLRMRERENSIYANSSASFSNKASLPNPNNFSDRALPQEILEEKREARINRLEQEGVIFASLMNTCTDIEIDSEGGKQNLPCVATSENIDEYLSQFVFFVLQNGPTSRKEEIDLFTSRDGADSQIGGFYLSPERTESLSKAVNEHDGPRWINIPEKKIEEAPEPIFPGIAKLGLGKQSAPGKKKKGPTGLNLFMLRLARVICIALGAALAYVLLSGKDIIPKLF